MLAANARVMLNARTIGHVSITHVLIHALDNAVQMQYANLVVISPFADAHKVSLAMRWCRVVKQEVSQLPNTIRKNKLHKTTTDSNAANIKANSK